MLFKGSQKIGSLDYEKEQVHLDRIEALYEQHFNETDPEKRAAIYAQINAENQLASAYAIPMNSTASTPRWASAASTPTRGLRKPSIRWNCQPIA